MDVRGFHHLAIQVRHLPEAVAFYQRVLKLKELTRYHRPDGSLRSVWLGVPGGFIALEEASAEVHETPFRDGKPGLHLVALRIDAAARARTLQELAELGVPVVHQTRWSIYIRDPEGNRIALSHHPEDPPA